MKIKSKTKVACVNSTIACILGKSSSSLVLEKLLSSDSIKQTKTALDFLIYGDNCDFFKTI
jgi:hypothetical protein